jgi:uncharacterized protein (TIGR03067 family)
MKVQSLLILVAGLLFGAGAVLADAAGSDRAKLQGTWKLESLEVQGKSVTMRELTEARLVVKGDCYRFQLGKTKLELTYRLDPAKQPKAIDLTIAAGPNKGKTFRGIYELDGDTFKICRHAEAGKERPAAFVTAKDSDVLIVVWKRVKP